MIHGTHRRLVVGSFFSWVAVSAFLLTSAGCGHVPELHFRLDDKIHVPDRQVILFVVDGMDAGRTDGLIDEGRLPHIRRRFVERGTRFTQAFGVFPSVTYANCTSIITGRFPGDHGIIGNTWYDPSTATFHDYRSAGSYLNVNQHLPVPTLFELVPDHPTLNLRYIMSYGADMNYALGTRAKILWWFNMHEAVDRQIIYDMRKALRAIRAKEVWPALTVVYLPSVDEVGHHHGPGSEAYARAMENVDRIIGRFTDAYAEAGLDGSTYYVLLSDHSMVATPDDRRFDLVRWFREEARQRVWTSAALPAEEEKRRAVLTRYDMILNINAGRIARIYLPGRENETNVEKATRRAKWLREQHALEFLLANPAVDLRMTPHTPHGVDIASKNGHAVIAQDGCHPMVYRFGQYDGDPLAWRGSAKLQTYLDGESLPSDLALPLTADTDYPDLIGQAIELFQSDRGGDVILTAAADWTFHPTWKGGHGSALRRDMQIPLYVAGPGIDAGCVETPVRSVDVVPTILEWLGVDVPAEHAIGLDGKSLLSRVGTVP